MNTSSFGASERRRRTSVHFRHARRLGAAGLALGLAMTAAATAGVGDLDTRFGVGGQVQVAGNAGANVLELPDGRILVIGPPAGHQGDAASARAVAINRYLASGLPDTSFGVDGRVVIALPLDHPTVSAAALQPDGRVVMAGSYWNEGMLPFVARVDRDGALDRGFGSDGVSEPGGGATEPFYSSLLVMQDGELLAAISDWTDDRIDRFAPDGRPLGNLSAAIAPWRMARQSDGRLVVLGYRRVRGNVVVMRLDPDGRVDETFGDNGFAALDTRYTSYMSIEPNGDRIVLCGAGVVRLTPDGHLDTTFGLEGTGYVEFGSDSVPMFDLCRGLVTSRTGGVVFVGIRRGQRISGDDRVFVAGLTSIGTVDTRFGAGTGASEIDLGYTMVTGDLWDISASFIATQDGNALLTWQTAPAATLARIDLGNEAEAGAVPPPTSTLPTATPTPAPTSDPTVDGRRGNGGGGGLALLDFAILALGLGAAARCRRARRARRA